MWVVVGLAALFVIFSVYVYRNYSGFIDKVFETKPMLVADRGEPVAEAEALSFTSSDGRQLEGSFLPARFSERLGVVLFLHEYGADRWMAMPYADYLRDAGFDLVTFDFGGCGASEGKPGYESLQWPTTFELDDARSALNATQRRLPQSPVVLVGVSKGGGTALALAGERPEIFAVVTDGAFPVHDMVVHYAMRFIEIFSKSKVIYTLLPRWFYSAIVWGALRRIERTRRVEYLNIERGIERIGRRPILMIRGQNDNYVNQEIVDRLFHRAKEPKELWIVPKAKHNKCLEREGPRYQERVRDFFVSAVSKG
jgi:pimeloyl-ACP methyl ester carboxylesterase